MFKSKRIAKLVSVTLMSSFVLISLSAQTLKDFKTPDNKPRTENSQNPKSLKIVESKGSMNLTTNDGNQIALPKYKTVHEDHPYSVPSSEMLLADAGAHMNMSIEMIAEKMLELKEMEELSGVLGVHITDASKLDLYREAADWLGTKYKLGGMSRKAVDCSGFTNIIYKNVFGQQLDRVSTVIARNVKESITNKEDLIPGDMVFFSTFGRKYINHVGVYLGDGKFVHASIKKGVIVSTLSEGYYSRVFRKGGRN